MTDILFPSSSPNRTQNALTCVEARACIRMPAFLHPRVCVSVRPRVRPCLRVLCACVCFCLHGFVRAPAPTHTQAAESHQESGRGTPSRQRPQVRAPCPPSPCVSGCLRAHGQKRRGRRPGRASTPAPGPNHTRPTSPPLPPHPFAPTQPHPSPTHTSPLGGASVSRSARRF